MKLYNEELSINLSRIGDTLSVQLTNEWANDKAAVTNKNNQNNKIRYLIRAKSPVVILRSVSTSMNEALDEYPYILKKDLYYAETDVTRYPSKEMPNYYQFKVPDNAKNIKFVEVKIDDLTELDAPI